MLDSKHAVADRPYVGRLDTIITLRDDLGMQLQKGDDEYNYDAAWSIT